MEDLYMIEKPFGLLDKETQDALRDNPDELEYFTGYDWVPWPDNITFQEHWAYRLKAKPPVPKYVPGVLYEWKGGPQPIPDHWFVRPRHYAAGIG